MNIETAKENIIALCKANKVPIRSLEREAGVSQGYIRASKENLRLSVVDVAARKFGVSTDDILYKNLVPMAKCIELNDKIVELNMKIEDLEAQRNALNYELNKVKEGMNES